MTYEQLPLYQFFLELRKREYHDLGVDDYEAVLEVIQTDLSFVESKQRLMSLCKALWVNPYHNLVTFESLFKEMFSPLSDSLEPNAAEENNEDYPSESTEENSIAPSKSDEPETSDQKKQSPDIETNTEEPEEVKPASMEEKLPDLEEVYLNIRKHRTNQPVTSESEREMTEQYNFLFWDEFLPFPRRQIEQQWRFFKKDAWEEDHKKLNINAMIDELAKNPVVFQAKYYPRKVNKAALVVLIDHSKNMAAFDRLTEVLVETAQQAAQIDTTVYYFRGQPGAYLYKDKAHTMYETMAAFLAKYKRSGAALLIISDAGVARQSLDMEWLYDLEAFLVEVKRVFQNIAWLNPLPKDRWEDTNVELLQEWIPVCELTPQGFRQVVQILRGRMVTY